MSLILDIESQLRLQLAMISAQNNSERTPTERRNGRRYVVEIISAGVAYCVLVIFSILGVEHVEGAAKYVFAGLPSLGAVAMCAAMVRFAMRLDELQRRMFADAGAIALLVTATATLSLGFLENAGLPHQNLTIVWPIAVGSWALAMPFVQRRYR
jgi:phosphatidylserine synthase